MRPPTNPDSGFTLLELLVALTLLAIFALTLAGGLRIGVQADAAVTSLGQAGDEYARADKFLRLRLAAVQPIWIGTAKTGHIDFSGAPTTMAFQAPTPQGLGGIGLSRYELAAEPAGSAARLVAHVTGPTNDLAASQSAATALLDDATVIRFAYFGMAPSGHGLAWQDSWMGRRVMPELIAIQVWNRRHPAAPALDVTVHPRIDIDTECALDVRTLSCTGY